MKDARGGFEPPLEDSKSSVLPLDDLAMKMEIYATNPTNPIVRVGRVVHVLPPY